jgi:hypothetical protein
LWLKVPAAHCAGIEKCEHSIPAAALQPNRLYLEVAGTSTLKVMQDLFSVNDRCASCGLSS